LFYIILYCKDIARTLLYAQSELTGTVEVGVFLNLYILLVTSVAFHGSVLSVIYVI